MLARLIPSRLAAAAIVAAVVHGVIATPIHAAETSAPRIDRVASTRNDRVINLPMSKSKILDFDEDIRDILVTDPKVADAVLRSSRRLYLIGNKFGNTNIVVFGTSGQPIANLELQVQLDTGSLEGLLKRLLPKSEIRVEAVAGTVMLSGTVGSGSEAIQAFEVASRFVGAPLDTAGATSGGTTSVSTTTTVSTGATVSTSSGSTIQVINALTIRGKDQVMLKVTVAEVQRDVIKMLGVNLTNSGSSEASSNGIFGAVVQSGNFGSGTTTNNSFPINTGTDTALDQRFTWDAGGYKLRARIQAMEQSGLIKTLAEPTLSAISGEQAQFLVGGEFPIPVSQSSSGSSSSTIGIEFKTYGVGLNFQPVVLADDRINLNVKTEVSELTTDGAITLSSITIPALRVRRASTTLEIPSGGAMVLGGLIKDDVRQAISGTPGLLDLPILGALFRSRDFKQSQSELLIFIQPILVHPVAASKLQRPDQNFRPSNDASAMMMGRLNRIYRSNGQSSGTYNGRIGYIFE